MADTPLRIREYIDKCVRCGSCKAQCPTYALRDIEPMSARGRVVMVGALIDGVVAPSELLTSRLSSCLLCGMCEGSCPVGVGITDVVYHGLQLLREQDSQRRMLRRLMGFGAKRPLMSYKIARMFKSLIPRLRQAGIIPFDMELPPEPLSVGLEIFKPQKPIGRVAIFAGCAVGYMRPELGRALIRVLFALGYEVVLPAGEVCCGAPLRALGMGDEAARLAARNMEVFGRLNAEAVLSLCPTCTLALGTQYAHITGQVMDNARDAIDFLSSRIAQSGIKTIESLREKPIVYHAPCHLSYGLGVKSSPVDMLRAAGLELSVPQNHNCCGFSQNMADRTIATDLGREMQRAYGAYETIVTACPGCMEQLSLGHPHVIHAIEALALPAPELS